MNEKELTEEQKKEIEKQIEERKKNWDDFLKKLKDAPEGTVTNAELTKVIDFISEDMDGIVQMIQMLTHNMNVMAHNFQQIMMVLQGGKANTVAKTKGGIILP